jgi:hypothetical protein
MSNIGPRQDPDGSRLIKKKRRILTRPGGHTRKTDLKRATKAGLFYLDTITYMQSNKPNLCCSANNINRKITMNTTIA